jgi:predicted component of type VI protein secretion system
VQKGSARNVPFSQVGLPDQLMSVTLVLAFAPGEQIIMKAELVPLNGDPPIPITKDVTVVGRREFCDLQIHFHGLSKRHCVLVKTDGLLVIRDLATTNGTKVNGQRIRWAALLPNDRVTMGGYKLKIYLGPDDAPSPSEQPRRTAAASAAPAAASKAPVAAKAARAVPTNGRSNEGPGSVGFATPSPLAAPKITRKDLEEPVWVGDDDLIDDVPEMPPWPARPPGAATSDDQEFVIDLD